MPTTARVYLRVAAELGLDELGVAIGALASQGHWQSVARSSLREDLLRLHRALTQRILEQKSKGDADRLTREWLTKHSRGVEHFRGITTDIHASGAIDFPTLSVALQSLRRLAGL